MGTWSGTPSPVPPELPIERDSRVDLIAMRHDLVALVVDDPATAEDLKQKLAGEDYTLTGPDMLWSASVVLLHVGDDLRRDVAGVRGLARSDAAIIVIHDPADTCGAREAGAQACIHPPFAKDQLLALIDSALDLRAAKAKVAELGKELDLESHLASIGRMTAGLTHELGNPLTVALLNARALQSGLVSVMSLVEALRDICFAPLVQREQRVLEARSALHRFDDEPDLGAALVDLEASLERLESLVVSLKPLARRDAPRLERVDLEHIVRDVVKWAERDFEGVEVELLVEPLKALADPRALGQLLYNLATNAAHAAKVLPSPRVRFHVYTTGDRAVISVRDNGPGIREDLQERIFEPFYTTRAGRGGTGLGLAICREYARQCEGTLSLWSQPGRGACFRLYLKRHG